MSSQLKTAVVIDDTAIAAGLTIDDVDFNVPFGEVQDQLREGQVSVSSADTHVKHLEDAIVGASGKTKLSKQNTGANESLEVDLDATSVTSGHVPTANGAGGWAWASPGGGGAAPIDVTGTAGEALALRDYVYLDESAGEWFKVDIDASASIKCGRFRGIVTEALGISAAGTGTIRLLGEISGYAGLTAWSPVYASSTAGGLTQTRPSPTSGGAQVAIIELGVAVSTTNIVLLPPKPVQYMKRDNALADEDTLTIEHHADAMGHTRTPKAYLGSSEAGSSLTSYADTNQDSDVELKGTSGAGDTESFNTGLASVAIIGDATNTEYRQAQSFTPSATGRLSQFTFELSTSTGSPTGSLHWQIRTDSGGSGPTTAGTTILASGDIANGSVVANATNTVNISNGPVLTSGTKYWIVLYADAQATDVRWRLKFNNTGGYAGGEIRQSSNSGTSWIADFGDAGFSVTLDAIVSKDKLAQGFQIGSTTTIATVRLWLKKVGSPTGNLTVKIYTNSGGNPNTLVTDGTSDVVAATTLATSYGWIDFTFSTPPSLTASTQYHIVLETTDSASNTNYVVWGADGSSPGYPSGEMKSEASAVWSAESMDAIFDVVGSGTTFIEFAVVGRWSGGTRDIAYRYDDGVGGDGTTKTTGKNVTGSSADVTLVVEVP